MLGDNARHEKLDLSIEKLNSITYFDSDMNENFSTSGFTIILERSPTRFFLNIYLPTFLLTIASFIGFLIPVEMVPGRMALLVTIFLMLVNISSTEQNRGPVVRSGQSFAKQLLKCKCLPWYFRQDTWPEWMCGWSPACSLLPWPNLSMQCSWKPNWEHQKR